MKNRVLFAFAVCLLGACTPVFEVYDLRVEDLAEPLAIDSAQPHFSWKIRSSAAVEQAAYEIEVEPSLWKTGKVLSDSEVMVPYEGAALSSRQQARWRVRIWNTKGRVSKWSPWQRFGTGILEPDRMQGEWIGAVPGEGRAPVLRKVFKADKAGGANLSVASLGYHEAWMNGERLSPAVLQPAVSQLDRRAQIITYDVSLQDGENEILIYAGSGWYKPTVYKKTFYEGPLVKAELAVDGIPVMCTDGSWEGAWSGYSDLGTWQPHEMGGELIVAGHKPEWGPVDVVKVEGVEESAQMCPPVLVQETLLPVSIEPMPDGNYLADFGRIVNAMMDITLPGMPEGTRVTARFGDFMQEDGSLLEDTRGKDIYVSSGAEGGDRFHNRFNHHLMRYMILEGLPKAPRAEDLRALRIGDALSWDGSFESSDADLNAIYSLVQNSLKNLSFGGYQVDCASIERFGYGGDGNASAQTFMEMTDASPVYLNWLQAWADAQQSDGGLPHTAPNPYSAGGGPYWCSFLVQAAWRSYMNYADRRPMERYYPAMKRWLGYADKYTADGLLRRWPDEEYRGWYLGDWAAPRGVDVDNPSSVELVNNCAMCQVYECLGKMALAQGLGADADTFRGRLEALRKRIHEEFYHPETATYGSGSQIDMVFPLLVGAVPDSLVDDVKRALMERTSTVYDGHLSTGLVGIPVISEWAAREGESDWMYGMLRQRGYPGYLHMIDSGATGTWEEWDGGRSHLHNCYNGIGSWFTQALGGITPLEPGCRRVYIDATLPEGLQWVRLTRPTPYGPIKVYKKQNLLEAELPAGVVAETDPSVFPGSFRGTLRVSFP